MRPLTDRTPKPLLPVGGKPLLVWHIERLRAAGYVHIVINHAHLGEQIEAALGDGAALGVAIAYSRETSALETAGGEDHRRGHVQNVYPACGCLSCSASSRNNSGFNSS